VVTSTAGQLGAMTTLEALARASGGALRLGDHLLGDDECLRVRLWLASASLTPTREAPALQAWEPIDLVVPPKFPLAIPGAAAGHDRFDGEVHVQWGRQICLYGSEQDWDPSGGMVDFVRRLLTFYQDLARGETQQPVRPWDRPVAYADRDAGKAILAADVPDAVRAGRSSFLTWAIGTPTGRRWADVEAWLTDLPPGREEDTAYRLAEALREVRRTNDQFLVPAVVLDRPIGFEFPELVRDLLRAIQSNGIPLPRLLAHLALTVQANRSTSTDGSEPDLLLLIRAPADRRFTLEDAQASFALWRIRNEDANAIGLLAATAADEDYESWLDTLDTPRVAWAKVYDTRPEVVTRRDQGRPASLLAGRRILVLGCGALGAPIAEHCVRAAAELVDVIDSGVVTPGVLVRQPYQESDLGIQKASALATRLQSISPRTVVCHDVVDALRSDALTEEEALRTYDLVIDATANRAVAVRLEQLWRDGSDLPSLVSVGIGRTATIGIATVTPPGARATAVDLLRRLALLTSDSERSDLTDVRDEFFPDHEMLDFFPEEGCSSATFRGSAADVNALAGLLLNESLRRLADQLGNGDGHPVPSAVSVVRACPDGDRPGVIRLPVQTDLVLTDPRWGFQVRMSQDAFRQLYEQVAAAPGADSDSPSETGGLLLGQIDDACGVVWVTQVEKLPEGSERSPRGVVISPAGARDHLRRRYERTGGRLGFVGYWHSHPASAATPSATDRETMTSLVEDDEMLAPALLLVAGVPETQSGAVGRGADLWKPQLHAEIFRARSRNNDELSDELEL